MVNVQVGSLHEGISLLGNANIIIKTKSKYLIYHWVAVRQNWLNQSVNIYQLILILIVYLQVGCLREGIGLLGCVRGQWCERADLLVRAARHYEGAAQILIRHAVMTARQVRVHFSRVEYLKSVLVLGFNINWPLLLPNSQDLVNIFIDKAYYIRRNI